MNQFIEITGRLKYVGLLGLPIFFSDGVIWKFFWLFWLFWLFAFVEIFATFPLIIQSLKQLIGIPYIHISHGLKLPDKNYRPAVQYSLPFRGQWTVVNGGPDKKESHSWSVTQRYAYDFIILEARQTYCAMRQLRQYI